MASLGTRVCLPVGGSEIVGRLKQLLCGLLALGCFLVGGCGAPSEAPPRKEVLRYGFSSVFKTFDPARVIYMQETVILAFVQEGLVRYNNDLQLEGVLATRWETTDDCNSWVFHLRSGVQFHDGTPFNATAVKLAFDRIQDPAVAATRRRLLDQLEKTEVIDDLTVRFVMKQPNCVFPEVIAGAFASIPSPTAMAKNPPPGMSDKDVDAAPPGTYVRYGQRPSGTGPYQLVSMSPDGPILLRRNPKHWAAERYQIPYVEFIPSRENTTRLILLEQGALDMADVAFPHVNVAKRTSDITVQSVPRLSIRYVGMNTQKPPFSDPRVRQAANYAVNKDEMVKYVFFGVGSPARGPIPDVLPSYSPDIRIYDYNPEKAKALLAEAGYPNGFDCVLWCENAGESRSIADATVEYLRKVGIRAELRILDGASYWDKFDEYLKRSGEQFPTKEGVYDMFVGSWVGGETAHGFLEALFTPKSYSNAAFYENPRVAELMVSFKNLAREEDRVKAYREMQNLIVEDAPWIFAYHTQITVGLRDRVQGFRVNPSGRIFLEDVRLKDLTPEAKP